MEPYDLDWKRMSDVAIAGQIAAFIKHTRLELNKTQQDLAYEAGISRSALLTIETGRKNLNVITLIQLLRALDSLHVLNGFKISTQPSPLQLAKLEGERRKRASRTIQNKTKNKTDW